MITRPFDLATRGLAWAADYVFVARWQLRSLLRRRPAWAAHNPDAHGVPVVLLPAIFESWRFLEPLGVRLAAAGHPVHVVNLGFNQRPVAALARRVSTTIAAAEVNGAVIVAHSKGGLIGKQLMLDELRRSGSGGTRSGEAGPAPRVLGMVAINTPFGGSRYAGFVPLASVRAMTPTAMRAFSAQRQVDDRITSVYAAWDPHVPEGSELAGATNVKVPQRGHFRVLGIRSVQDTVLAAVERTAAYG